MPPLLRLDPGLQAIVQVGVIHAVPVRVQATGPDLESEIERVTRALVDRHAGAPPSRIPGLAPARELYKAFGIDPTRTRPSSEALLRRVLQNKPFPRILNAVDLANLCGLEFLLPIGLYDAGKIAGPVIFRRGEPGESYRGIRKDRVNLDGRPLLADSVGPFGNPTSDSLRTSVTPATGALWMVVFAGRTSPAGSLEAQLDSACAKIERHLAAPGERFRIERRIVR